VSNRSVFALVTAGIVLAMANSKAAELVAADNSASDAVVRKTIEKSIPFIEEKGLYWIEKKKCVSCHRVSFMTWSLSSAARRGFDVDVAKVNEWIDWSIEKGIPQPDGDKHVATKNAEGLTQ
jgi:squalene-hopene/tetraprenyl-beta-curcumene cyclase